MRRILEPALQSKFGLCTADHVQMSEAASAVLILPRKAIKKRLGSRCGTDAD